LCAQKKLPFLRIGKTYRFAVDAVATWIEEHSNTTQRGDEPDQES